MIVSPSAWAEIGCHTHVGDRHAQSAIGQAQRDRYVDVRLVGAVPTIGDARLAACIVRIEGLEMLIKPLRSELSE